jgi:hypothetical protein
MSVSACFFSRYYAVFKVLAGFITQQSDIYICHVAELYPISSMAIATGGG